MKKQTLRRISKKAGKGPEAFIYTGDFSDKEIDLSLICYNEEEYLDFSSNHIDELLTKISTDHNNWLNFDGVYDHKIIEKIGTHFGLHPLILEDILNIEHLPKADDYDDYLFITCKMLNIRQTDGEIEEEQVSFIAGSYYLLSFQEKPGDVFNPVRERLKKNLHKVRKRKTDYLLYLLLDCIVDNYFIVLQSLEDKIGTLEDAILESYQPQIAQKILINKKELNHLRSSIYPLREEVNKLIRTNSSVILEETERYFNDINDHLIQLAQILDSFRDTITDLMELHISNNSNRMNSIMMSLTIVATIFIPLTFIVGLYGMNFHYMPEIGWRFGYPMVLIFMALVTSGMFYYMKKKNWF